MDDRIFPGGTTSAEESLQSLAPLALTREPARARRASPGGLPKPLPFAAVGFALKRSLLVLALLFLILFTEVIAFWPVVASSTAFALAFKNPNSRIPPPAWLTLPTGKSKKPNLAQNGAPSKLSSDSGAARHPWPVAMKPARLLLSNAGQQFVSSDGQLEVDLPANSLDTAQLAQTKGGILLYITQVKPGSGSSTGGSGQIFFGTYEFQFFDGTGRPLSHVHLLHPFTIHFRLRTDQRELVWSGQQVYALWSAVQGSATPPTIPSPNATQPAGQGVQTGVVPPAATTQPPTLLYAQEGQNGLDWSVQSTFAAPGSQQANAQASSVSSLAVQASSVTFGTQAPQATWGTPADFQVGLNSGGLNYSYPLTIPPGPGGFQPSLSLNYSSGSVNENHGWQSTAPWVGEGWSLNLGSISWSQENVTPNGSATYENVWHITDPSGISGQLIPPDLTYSTIPPYNPSSPTSSQVWHTAPESHAKIIEKMFNGQPCWRVYLPSGITEEFGCTNDSRESYVASNGDVVQWSWNLDLMIDRYGNQVHVSYQTLHISAGYVRDAVLSDVTYDDPTCHNTTTACSTWHPLVDIHFDASQSVVHLLNSGCGSGTSGQYRCDAPKDLSGSGGLPVPKVLNSYVLNDVKVEVQGNVLHEYVFSYNQGGPQTITDPNTGKSESVAGYLTLGKIQEEGTNGTSLNAPVISISYQQKWEHYADLFSYAANNGTVCSPYSNAPRDGSSSGPCYLWSQSYNAYYISNLDNGRGWNESITWKEAHSNTWGTDSGNGYNDAFACSSSQTSTNVCGKADDKNWSRVVVQSRTASSNSVTSTWSYNYYLQTGLGANFPGHSAISCSGSCTQHPANTWGNQNDDDYADYYNGDFQSYKQVQVSLPDGSSQTLTYGATNGWGLYSTGITCYTGGTCVAAPFNSSSGPVMAGKETKEQDYDSNGHLLKEIDWSYATNCPPPGVSGSAHAAGGSTDPGGAFLFSELDHNNPIMVCDPRVTQEDDYLTDGVTSTLSDARVVHTTKHSTYDGNGCGEGYDYGNVTTEDTTANDVAGVHFLTENVFCPNDNLGSGIFLTDLLAKTYTQDQSGNQYGCHANFYGSNTGDLQAPSVPSLTRTEDHTPYNGTPQNCVGAINATLHSYDASGNMLTTTDPDGHLGCTSGSAQYSACATYDSTYQTHLLTATNAKNQTTTYSYDSSASGGFGQWLISETDPNGQTTTYQYDALGRLTAVIRPGDSLSSPTITYTYTNTCSAGSTTPCLELDTATTFTSGGPTSVEKQWYDGWGHLVETQTPSPTPGQTIVTYTVYDQMNRATTRSLPYAIATPSGYVAPDLNQPRTVTSYDSLGRALGTVTYGQGATIVQESTISYTVAQGVPTISSESSTAYEQTITLDAYNHQTVTYTDGLGRTRYTQVFSGTASPYSVVRTVGTTYDMLGNTVSVTTFDSTGTAQATYSAVYNGVKELLGMNDSDLGSCANTPMPADCSGPTDTAWKYTYDADGNRLSQTDARNQSRYTTYDALDRPLCSALSASDASSCGGTTDEVTFYDGYSNASTPGATFPSGCTAPTGSYASDPIGRKTAERFVGTSGAGSGWRCYGYDQRGQTDQSTLSVTTPDAGTVTQTVKMLYNDGGQVTGLVYPDGETLTSTYDLNGRLQSIYFGTPASTDPVQFLVGKVSYTNNGQIAGMAIGGTAPKASVPTPIFSTATTYDAIQRPLSTSATEAGQTIWSQTRTYDNVGNVLGLSTVVPTQSGGSATENEAFCYDALNRLVWAGNSGTPTGGDHCMAPPSGTTLTPYTQAYSSDALDRLSTGPAGSYSYADANQVHAVTGLSTIPNQYAAYDAMGNMTCRNTDTSTAHTCAGSSPTGALMSYDSRGQLATWSAPSGTVGSAHYLYDLQGNRVLTNSSTASSTTDTVYFDGYTETVLSGGTTTTTKYYSANGTRIALRIGGATLDYLLSDPLGSNSVALNDTGQVIGLEHYSPYGTVDYSWGSMPTSFNYAGERLDSQTGLLYDNFRYYDPLSGRFVRADNVQDNSNGMDPYAYVGDNPETRNDPSGHCFPLCLITAAVGAVVGAAVNVGVTVVSNAMQGKPTTLGEIAQSAVVGGITGAITGALGPEAGPLAKMAAGAVAGGLSQMAGNAMSGKPLMDGVAQAAVAGGITGGLVEGAGAMLKGAKAALQGASTEVEDLSESGIKNTLSKLGARTMNADEFELPYNENRLYLGHYGGNGIITNGMRFPINPANLPGLRQMETWAADYGGKVLSTLPATMEAMQPHIDAASQILFNVGESGIGPGTLTAQEFQYVIGNPNILEKTIFTFGHLF